MKVEKEGKKITEPKSTFVIEGQKIQKQEREAKEEKGLHNSRRAEKKVGYRNEIVQK